MTSSQPLVSVCIPAYNYAEFLGRAIASVIRQTYARLEIVVLDNASRDDFGPVLAPYQDRVQYVRFADHVSMYANFNRGLGYAHGEFLKFLCADDELEPEYIDEAVHLFCRYPTIGVVSAPEVLIDKDSRPLGTAVNRYPGRKGITHGRAVLRKLGGALPFCVSPTHCTYRMELLRHVGGFNAQYLYADLDLWIRLLTQADLGWLNGPRVRFRLHAQNAHRHVPGALVFCELCEMLAGSPNVERGVARHLLTRQGSEAFWSLLKNRGKAGCQASYPDWFTSTDRLRMFWGAVVRLPGVLVRRLPHRNLGVKRHRDMSASTTFV